MTSHNDFGPGRMVSLGLYRVKSFQQYAPGLQASERLEGGFDSILVGTHVIPSQYTIIQKRSKCQIANLVSRSKSETQGSTRLIATMTSSKVERYKMVGVTVGLSQVPLQRPPNLLPIHKTAPKTLYRGWLEGCITTFISI